MNVLDALLVVAGVSFAVSGYRQGLLVGVLTIGGFLGGGLAGLAVAPRALAGWAPGPGQAAAAVAFVLLLAFLGQLVAGVAARSVRERIRWRPVRYADAGLGALVSVLALLLVSYVVASALRQAPLPVVARQIGGSTVLGAVDRTLPDDTDRLFRSFRSLLDERSAFPRVFAGLGPERITPVQAPTEALRTSPVVARARGSTVRVAGAAAACGRRVEGSGVVVAPERVMTNAHVVAGVDRPQVQVGGAGPRLEGRVVHFDPARDVAVLRVPGLAAPPLPFDGSAERGDDAIVVGYPGGGSYTAVPARVREEITARGPDIYSRSSVTRDVLSLRTVVRPGNSGGPVLSPDGAVVGLVFATSIDDDETGYALTVDEVSGALRTGATATDAVPTGECSDG